MLEIFDCGVGPICLCMVIGVCVWIWLLGYLLSWFNGFMILILIVLLDYVWFVWFVCLDFAYLRFRVLMILLVWCGRLLGLCIDSVVVLYCFFVYELSFGCLNIVCVGLLVLFMGFDLLVVLIWLQLLNCLSFVRFAWWVVNLLDGLQI